jgi:3'-5' exonuclease
MLDNIKPEDILFIDIETVPQSPSMNLLDPRMQTLWDKKSKSFRSPEESASDVYGRAGIYAEFGRIICISAGFIRDGLPVGFRVKSFFGNDERELLKGFSTMLAKFSATRKDPLLCAHNGKEFDYPYIARRLVINSMNIPAILDNAGKKPWEVRLLDTMDLWKFGDFKNYTSLDLLTAILGIASPKDDIDGSMVAKVYYEDNDLERIVRYCEKDVLAIAQILLRFRNLPLIKSTDIESVTSF